MSKTSSSGILTLVALLLAGPTVYGVRFLHRRCFPDTAPDGATTESQMKETELHSVGSPATQPSGAKPAAAQEEGEPEVDSVSYMLGLLGYAVGIGNVWRFPYLVGRYGGGAFVFAYLVCLLAVAMPLYLVELGLGQHTRAGSIATLQMIRPRYRSLGWAQVGMVSVIVAYYNVLLAYACVYIVASCQSPLPWAAQGSENYWNEEVLHAYPTGEGQGLGPLQWQIVVALMVVYVCVFFSVGYGKQLLTKITWVTVVGPVLLMVILFIRTVGLPGAEDGVQFYLGKFHWAELYSGELWAVACGQIIFSLSPGCGTAIALSSNISPKEDVYRVCVTVGLCNSGFSLFGGFAIFSILGNLARETGQDVAVLASQSGTGLAFISIADGITNFGPAANAMSVLFFVMLLTLGLDSTFAWMETIIAAARETCKANDITVTHTQVVGALCVFLFLCGLPFCTRGGNDLLDVVDHFVGAWFLLVSCCLECILFRLDFGWDHFAAAIRDATRGNVATPGGRELESRYWKLCVYYVAPAATFGLWFAQFVQELFVGPYGAGGYSAGLVGVGWAVFVVLSLTALLTIADQRPGRWTGLDPVAVDAGAGVSTGAHEGRNGPIVSCSCKDQSPRSTPAAAVAAPAPGPIDT